MDIAKLIPKDNKKDKGKASWKNIKQAIRMGLPIFKMAVKKKDKKNIIIMVLVSVILCFYGLTSIIIDIIKLF